MKEPAVLFRETLVSLLEEKKYPTLRDVLVTLNPADIAALFEELPADRLPLLFRLLPKELAAETFVEMEPDEQELLIRGFSDNELKEVIDELYLDDAVDIVEEMPANVVQRILRSADPDTRKMINEILRIPRGQRRQHHDHRVCAPAPAVYGRAGHQAHPPHRHRQGDHLYLLRHRRQPQAARLCLGQDAAAVRRGGQHRGRHGDQRHLRLYARRTGKTVAQPLPQVQLSSPCPWWTRSSAWWALSRWTTRIDVMQEETTEDIEKMAAITPSGKPYLKTSVFALWKARIPWLLLLMISATFTGMIITAL